MNEYRPTGFKILPPVVKNLIIINVILFLLKIVLRKFNVDLDYSLALFYPSSPFFEPWQIVTHLFMHANWAHLFFNMFALWMFGNVIENLFGPKRFLIFYFVCGLGAALLHFAVYSLEFHNQISWFSQLSAGEQNQLINQFKMTRMGPRALAPMVSPVLGASGAIFGVLFAFGYLFPNLLIYIYFLFPVKAKYFVAFYALLELFSGFTGNDNIAHWAHIGGMLFAFLLLRIWRLNHKNTYLS
jgi:membrane associated rhomboid family serine protease